MFKTSSKFAQQNLLGLENVKNILSVGSCKGGVGKSTVAVNFAFAMQKLFPNLKIGLLDCDVFGPSLPFFLPKLEIPPNFSQNGSFLPFSYKGVKLMSVGFLKPNAPLALRGPMVTAYLQQLLQLTKWGDLDFLVLDLPPGTSDAHLTLAQNCKIDGNLIVTTPHKLSLMDTEKGIKIFQSTLKVPTVGIVENLSFFECGNCEKKHEIFGPSKNSQKLAEAFGIENFHALPFLDEKSFNFETDRLIKNENVLEIFGEMVKTTTAAVLEGKKRTDKFELVFSEGEIVLKNEKENERFSIKPRELRKFCLSADKKSEIISNEIFPLKIEPAGFYAFRVDWSDGHHSLFPIKNLKAVMAKDEKSS